MNISRQFSIAALLVFTVFLAASCQTPATGNANKNKADSTATKHGSNRQLFRDSIPPATGYVNDYDSIYTPVQKLTIDSLLADFEKKTTMQIAIITFDTGMLEKDSLEAVTTRIGNYWGVGQKDKNNGITIGICSGYGRMTIRNGAGIEKILTDAATKEIIDNAFIPGFKKADYYEGTVNGLKDLMEILIKKTEGN